MRNLFLLLALLLVLVIAVFAWINNEVVTVNYLFGQLSTTLFTLIVGSALAGALVMGFLIIFRSIQTYMKSQPERNLRKEMQKRVKTLEEEKEHQQEEMKKLQKERDEAVASAMATLEYEKDKLEEELKRQQQEREEASTQALAKLEDEKKRLEEELRKQAKEQTSSQ